MLARAIAYEWAALWTVMALSVANVVLGVWRPRLSRRPAAKAREFRPKPADARTVAARKQPSVKAA